MRTLLARSDIVMGLQEWNAGQQIRYIFPVPWPPEAIRPHNQGQ